MRRGDSDFRITVDRALSQIFKSGEIGNIFTKAFGAKERPSPVLQALYIISTLPE